MQKCFCNSTIVQLKCLGIHRIPGWMKWILARSRCRSKSRPVQSVLMSWDVIGIWPACFISMAHIPPQLPDHSWITKWAKDPSYTITKVPSITPWDFTPSNFITELSVLSPLKPKFFLYETTNIKQSKHGALFIHTPAQCRRSILNNKEILHTPCDETAREIRIL